MSARPRVSGSTARGASHATRGCRLRRRRGAAACAVALMPFGLACAGDEPAGGWAGTMVDSAGVVVVTNPEEGMWSSANAWTLEEELRIGTFGGDPRYLFGQVGSIAVGAGGEIYVSDKQSQEVRVFSASGTYLRTMGGAGSGPGELGLGASVLLLGPGDTLLVPDLRNRRINRYAPDGSSLESTPLHPDRERPLRYYLGPGGGMAVQLRPVAPAAGPAAEGLDAIRRIDAAGAFRDTLLEVPSGGLIQGNEIHYFTPEPMWALTDSLTVIYGVNAEYRIGFYSADGVLRRVVQRSVEPLPITERDKQAIFGFVDRALLDAGAPPSRLAEQRRRTHFADYFPAFSVLHVGMGGSLWVQRVQAPGALSEEDMARYNFAEDFGAPGWEVFDAEGRFLGVVQMPRRFQPRLFRDDRIYGVLRDELDVQYVLRMRVVGE